jgi:hypothetical protein
MKLYRTPTGHWAGTKDEAITIAKVHDTAYEQYDVPYDKAGLLAFLNGFKVGATPAANSPVDDEPFVIVRKPVFVKPSEVTSSSPQKIQDRMELEDAILAAPLDTAVALAELVMCRIRDFTKGK